jgi:hypothetical protein
VIPIREWDDAEAARAVVVARPEVSGK